MTGGGARFERVVMIAVLMVLTVMVAYGEFARGRAEREARARDAFLAEEIAAARLEAQAAVTSLIPQEIVQRANASVYAIVVNDRLYGTAFVVDRENGVLVTAAHVTKAIPFDEEDARIRIFNRFDGAPIAISEVRNHAGYGAFRELVEAFQPVRPHTPILNPRILPLRDLAFDAALLIVDPLDPETGENRLGPDLPIAAEEELLQMSAGAPIAVIGFPYDTLDDSFAAASATSRVERGVISAMIAPLDNAAAAGDPVIANLIIHRLATAGGNSGSPVINAAGEVVGIHTHGIESMSGNADGAAQRADVIHDLLIEARDETRLTEVFVPAWRQVLGYWRSARDVLPWSFYLERTDPETGENTLVADFDLKKARPFDMDVTTYEFAENQDTFIAFADDLPAGAVAGGDKETIGVSQEEGRNAFVIRRVGEYAEASFTIDRAKDNVIFAFDYSLRRQLGFCRLAAYWRKEGEARLALQKTRASTELFFPAKAELGEETYHIVFRRRKNCDPASQSFDAGVLSWTPGEEKTENPRVAAIAQILFPRPDHVQFQTPDASQKSKILNLKRIRCLAAGEGEPGPCAQTPYIDAEVIAHQEAR